jgi:hypothetical protein
MPNSIEDIINIQVFSYATGKPHLPSMNMPQSRTHVKLLWQFLAWLLFLTIPPQSFKELGEVLCSKKKKGSMVR